MDAVIVIPARFASTRLPGKPLLRETGKFLIQHVYEQASKAKCAKTVIVATDDDRIARSVRSFGGEVAMTRADHASGTDRIAEVARNLACEIVINVQGDEPTIDPDCIDKLAGLMHGNPSAEMATLAVPIKDEASWRNPNIVKAIHDDQGRAVVFSRSSIPFCRDGQPDFASGRYLQHLGIYAYRREALLKLASMPPHPWEEIEKLEQLRALAQGWTIQLGVVQHAGRGVDTPDDYVEFVHSQRLSLRMAA